MIEGKYPCTGCVATVGAQIMYYYQWPKVQTKAVPSYTTSSKANTSEALPPIQFQWDKMKTCYVNNDPNTEAVNAVADLMLYCGYAAKMMKTTTTIAKTKIKMLMILLALLITGTPVIA